jgi:transcriptional regulator PpsR
MPQHTQKFEMGRLGSAASLLSGLEPDTLARLLATPADLVLVLDPQGMVRDISLANEELVNLGCQDWLGRPWREVVTVESRRKIDAMVSEALAGGEPSPRQVNHTGPTGQDLPVVYRVMPLLRPGETSPNQMLAFGRDLRGEMALQQRLVAAQVSMERDYWRLRHVETRYRLLFQQAAEPVLILDARTDRLDEANPAAQNLFGDGLRRAAWTLAEGLDPASAVALRETFTLLRANGRVDPLTVRVASSGHDYRLVASLLRQEDSLHFLVRLSPLNEAAVGIADNVPQLLEAMQQAPDAFVLTDLDGRVIRANRAFLALSQSVSEEVVRGEMLDRWLGRSGVDLNVLVSNLRQHGSLRLFATQLRGELGSVTEVEISAVAAMTVDPPCMGLTIRDISRRLAAETSAPRELPRSPDQMTELVGRMPLKDIVRDTTDLIEQLCIEAALKLTSGNRASAAEMLGLSRQSLYVKLRRFGLGAPGDE